MNPLNNSWIKLPRSFTSWRWYHDSKMVHVFLYFLLQANVKKTDYLSLTVYPGQVVTSLAIIAEDTGLSPRNIRTCLQKLSQTGDIKVHSSNKGTIVTIRDYSRFQLFSDEDATIGWIKLYRKITEWNWYHDAEKVHLFIHLLLNAVFQQQVGSSLKRAQLALSKNTLHKETRISPSKISTCLNDLVRTGEIEVFKSPTPRPNQITVCKYELYQGFTSKFSCLDELEDSCSTKQSLFDGNSSPLSSDLNPIVSSCCRDIYGVDDNLSDKQLTNERQVVDTQVSYHRQGIDMQATTNIKGYNVKNERISTSMRVCACEGILGEVENVPSGNKTSKESYFSFLSNSDPWLEVMKRRFKLPDRSKVKTWLETFELDMACRGKGLHKDLSDYQSHFCDWLSKQNLEQSKSMYGSKFTPRSSHGGQLYESTF